MAQVIRMPKMSDTMVEGVIANWLKKEGDSVAQDEILAEIETDKVVLEVVAPSNGVLTKIIKNQGDIVNSAEVIGKFDDSKGDFIASKILLKCPSKYEAETASR